ncbi:hypothetical protein ACPOL_6973 (plasmid) [Acidisarcina polymorpha]|uniref:Uncharacterized protein n=1 Tax=Acidisarcina polymorpha TaxID=2211140 RepID=A0A2Z5GBJ6_9BACT|nr:hypothetical protein [Acidisarcina polymorpha]AXC16177.1 hypothetical protein ACPOL_6973 [Acidisarcina polymorpha]
MAETPDKAGDRSARELAKELLPYLETVANLHYLLDWHVVNPDRLKELRAIEDEAFNGMLKHIQRHID